MKQYPVNPTPPPWKRGLDRSQTRLQSSTGVGLHATVLYDLEYASRDLILANLRLSEDKRQVSLHACDPDGWWDDLSISLEANSVPAIHGDRVGVMPASLKSRIASIVASLLVLSKPLPEVVLVGERGSTYAMKVPLWPAPSIASNEAQRMIVGFIVSRDNCGPHADFHVTRRGMGFLPFRVHYSLGKQQRPGVYYEDPGNHYIRPKALESRLKLTTEILLEQYHAGLLSRPSILIQDGGAPPVEPKYAVARIPVATGSLGRPT